MAQETYARDGEPGDRLPIWTYDEALVRRGAPRSSRMGRRRAAVLIGIHVAFLGHLLHWKLTGTSLSPMEPSEAVHTLTTGVINAGAVLFGATLLATLVFGRFFCGWGCHLVALQDLCGAFLKRIGFRPRPLQSRALVWVPLLAGLYMFFWPLAVHAIEASHLPDFTLGLSTGEFWATFPGLGVSILTFASCGFAIVWLLGSKGFCTYACPYGGFFGVLDGLAPGRIRVTDACLQCGHCSAVCTSNVDVSDEVHLFGMVVNPGCMKCMDCVSTCPEDALYFGFGRPSFFARALPRRRGRERKAMFSRAEEFALAATCGASLLVFRGLYGHVAFLFALGLAAMTAFAVVIGARVARGRDVSFWGRVLAEAGRRTRAGAIFAGIAALWLVFGLHSAVYQGHMYLGTRALVATQPAWPAAWRGDRAALSRLDPAIAEAVDAGARHLDAAERWGLFTHPHIGRQRAVFALVDGDAVAAAAYLRNACALAPRSGSCRHDLGRALLLSGDVLGALEELGRAVALAPDHPEVFHTLARAQLGVGDRPGAEATLRQLVERFSGDAGSLLDLGLLRLQAGDPQGALPYLDRYLALRPDDPDARVDRAGALRGSGRDAEAAAELERAHALAPERPRVTYVLAEAYRSMGRRDDALRVLDTALAGGGDPRLRALRDQIARAPDSAP